MRVNFGDLLADEKRRGKGGVSGVSNLQKARELDQLRGEKLLIRLASGRSRSSGLESMPKCPTVVSVVRRLRAKRFGAAMQRESRIMPRAGSGFAGN